MIVFIGVLFWRSYYNEYRLKIVNLIMTQQNNNCVFCRICNEEEQSEILYKVCNNIKSRMHNVANSNLCFVSRVNDNAELEKFFRT